MNDSLARLKPGTRYIVFGICAVPLTAVCDETALPLALRLGEFVAIDRATKRTLRYVIYTK